MNCRAAIVIAILPLLPLATAQDGESTANGEKDPIAAAIEAFNNRDRSKPNEVVVVLDPPPASPQPEPAGPAGEEAEETGKPVLVTGKPPKDASLIDISEIPVDPAIAGELPPASQSEPKGLAIRVENVQQGSGDIEPETVRLLAPFPAKPLQEAPDGWLLESSNSAPAFQRQVELAPGKSIKLTIRPHILVPDADNDQIIAVQEPGFEASLGYQQSDTVSAVLSNSIERLDEGSREIGAAIDQLQQLIVSLPKPEGASTIPDAKAPKPAKP